MITRIGRGWATTDNADAYQRLLDSKIAPTIMNRHINGLPQLVVLKRADEG